MPNDTRKIETLHRRIVSEIPHPEDIKLSQALSNQEPRGFDGQTEVVWDKAEGVYIFDRHGNQWIDFTSGILVANAGHGTAASVLALETAVTAPLHHTYIFKNRYRAELVDYLLTHCAPSYLDKVALLTTGSEANECALKICRHYAHHGNSGDTKDIVISMQGAYHGRTMGSQMAGGSPALKQWIRHPDPGLVNVAAPESGSDGATAFSIFVEELTEKQIEPNQIAGILIETYLGWKACLYPKSYIQHIRDFCDEHQILLIFDEVQAGFGRCGKMWGFEHYDVKADMIVCGKGISSGLPVSAVIGRAQWMDLFPPGTLTSTHLGNPLGCAAALANLKQIVEGGLAQKAATLGAVLAQWLADQKKKHQDRIGHTGATGLVAVIELLSLDQQPDQAAARQTVANAIANGVMMIAPGGAGAGSVKICPPLSISEEQLLEGLQVLDAAIDSTGAD